MRKQGSIYLVGVLTQYTSTRREDIDVAADPVEDANDVVRFFNRDSPEQQFECGQSTGGKHPCSTCEATAPLFMDHSYSATR